MRIVHWLLGLDETATIASTQAWDWYAASPLSGGAVLCIAMSGLAVAALNWLPQSVMRWHTRALLSAVRLAVVAIAGLMLARLECRVTVLRELSPNVALVTDRSASMGIRDAGERTRYDTARRLGNDIVAGLGRRVQISSYDFDWDLHQADASVAPAGTTGLMDTLITLLQSESDLQAVVLLTDGNDTTGTRPEAIGPVLAKHGVPVYPIVLGSSAAPPLGKVSVAGNVWCRLGDELRLTATVQAEGLEEQSVGVRLFQEGLVESIGSLDNVRVGAEPNQVSFVVTPNRAGRHTYRVMMDGMRQSSSDDLLIAEHRVDVIDARIRVLYVDVPRDERKILAHWLARDPVVDLATLTMLPKGGWYAQGALFHENSSEGLPQRESDLYKYDVMILGDIPRSYFRAGGDLAETKLQWIYEFVNRRGGGLAMLGGRNAYAAGQYQGSTLAVLSPFVVEPTADPQIPETFAITPTVLGLAHPVMRLAADADTNREAWYDLPTLEGCNRVGAAKPAASLLAIRHVGDETAPVMALQNVGKGKVLGMTVDTTWRWEMMRELEAPDHFCRFWGNVARFLAPDPRLNPKRPQLRRHQSLAPVGTVVTLSTRLVDESFRPIRGADLRITVTSPSGSVTRIYPSDGRGTPGIYEYDVHLAEPGTWVVAATYGGKTATDEIRTESARSELADPRAKPGEMARLARMTGGKAFGPSQVAELVDALVLGKRMRTQTYAVAVWNLPVVMMAVIVLVCLDCYVRKRRGMV